MWSSSEVFTCHTAYPFVCVRSVDVIGDRIVVHDCNAFEVFNRDGLFVTSTYHDVTGVSRLEGMEGGAVTSVSHYPFESTDVYPERRRDFFFLDESLGLVEPFVRSTSVDGFPTLTRYSVSLVQQQ